jgi:glycosyltransferase involved in cell wall biosynthesis
MNRSGFAPCIVIPIFNHAATVPALLKQLAPYHLPCILINDGSDSDATDYLRRLVEAQPDLILEEQFPNQGKGAAVMRGLHKAADLGYSHGVQVDADGQHCIEDLPRLLEAAQKFPEDLVTGIPVYDHSVPKGRLIGRYVTHFWVWVETLSLRIKDSMCGFRVYPLAGTLALIDKAALGQRMDFDTDIMVRLYWRGLRVISVATRVIYPENGTSNFRLWRDNCSISWMHTRLVLGMLPRAPLLLWRNLTGYYRLDRDR